MRLTTNRRAVMGWVLALTVFAGSRVPAHAGDGVIEINQAKALAGGVTAGDSEGFPVTISESGSYRLTGNLTVPDENTTAIQITADHVSIDLNGFAIQGPCTFSTCDSPGTGTGIESTKTGISIANGTVRGMGSHGIGIEVLDFSPQRNRISNVIAAENGRSGIYVQSAVISGCVANRNHGSGVQTQRSVVADNVADGNQEDGIVGLNSMIRNNNSVSNTFAGIRASDGSLVIGNTASFNGTVGLQLSGSGIGYADNVLGGNTSGTVIGGVEMGTNVCGTNTTCP